MTKKEGGSPKASKKGRVTHSNSTKASSFSYVFSNVKGHLLATKGK